MNILEQLGCGMMSSLGLGHLRTLLCNGTENMPSFGPNVWALLCRSQATMGMKAILLIGNKGVWVGTQ